MMKNMIYIHLGGEAKTKSKISLSEISKYTLIQYKPKNCDIKRFLMMKIGQR